MEAEETQLVVYQAESGGVLHIPVLPTTTVSGVKEFIAQQSGIPPNYQVLLCEHLLLDDTLTLSSYQLPSDDQSVYLFNRKTFMPDALLPTPTTLTVEPIKFEPNITPSKAQIEVVANFLDILSEFRRDRNFAKRVLKAINERLALCRECCAQQVVMVKALMAARANSHHQYQRILRDFDKFKGRHVVVKNKHQNLLDSFETDMIKLRDTPVHPALRTPQIQSLIGVIPENEMRCWAADCKQEHEQLNTQIENLEETIKDIKHTIDAEQSRSPDLTASKSSQIVDNSMKERQDVSAIETSLLEDMASISAKLKDLKEEKINLTQLTDLVKGYDETRKTHRRLIAKLQETDRTFEGILQMVAQTKTRLSMNLYNGLHEVSVLQYRIRKTSDHLTVLKVALERQDKDFTQLLFPRNLPKAYMAGIKEIMRRKAFGAALHQNALAAAQALQSIYAQERSTRERFQSKNGMWLPKAIIPGLDEALPNFGRWIRITEFDKRLPAIDPDPSLVSSLTMRPLISSGSTTTQSEHQSGRMAALERENEQLLSTIEEMKRLQNDIASTKPSPVQSPSNNRPASDSGIIDRSTEYIDRIKDLEEKLNAENVDLRAQLNQAVEEKKFLEQQIQHERETISKFEDQERSRIKETSASQAAFTQQIAESRQDILRARGKSDELDAELARVRKANDTLSETLASVSREKESLFVEKEQLQRQLDQLSLKSRKIVDQFQIKRQKLPNAPLSSSVSEGAGRPITAVSVDSGRESVIHQANQLLQLTKTIGEKNAKITALEDLLSQTEKKQSTQQQLLSRTQSAIENRDSDIQRLQDQVKTAGARLKELEAERDQAQARSGSKAETEELIRQFTQTKSYSLDLEERLKVAHATTVALQGEVQALRATLEVQQNKVEHGLEHPTESSRSNSIPIALKDFKPEDLVLFLADVKTGVYEAYNQGAPHYFLSEESRVAFRDSVEAKAPIQGHIVFVETVESAAAGNAHGLPPGTAYHEVTLGRS
eukprot:TRINITY_DN3465_c1_g1_i2.p1 TRINITY_DN3465_c1_g1~~TRINITY_DN3465_c1_g1_i2.p1  ORF type:complete len:1003 (-),score=140.98 TRINITY_DN3465_c1_g1_i2:154-3162(-)